MENISEIDKNTLKEQEKKKYRIKRLFDSAFPADKEWNNWFFEKVYREDEAMYIDNDEGKIASCLFLQHYDFAFHGQTVPLAYVAGATTDFKMRHQGFMSHLLREALQVSYDRGDTFIGLIPAERRLFFLYDKFGFATVVLADIERYTSLHSFPVSDEYVCVEPTFEAFSALERLRSATVIHSEEDFENILFDITHDGGCVVQINDSENRPMAMAFAVGGSSEIHVKELLGPDPRANNVALGEVKNRFDTELPMAVWRLPTGRQASLRAHGMMRIVNVRNALSALAAAHPTLRKQIKVSDPLIQENNAIFILKDGNCTESIKTDGIKLDLDVTVDVLTKILFSSAAIGNIFNIPSSHPAMALMLD